MTPILIIREDKDADKASDLITALSLTAKVIAKVAKPLVGKVELRPDEMLVMVDSGSFVHAIDAQVEKALQGIEIVPPTNEETSRWPKLLVAES